MRVYELILVLKSLTEGERKKLVTAVKDLLGKAKFTKDQEWGSKALKYKIKHEEIGYYYDFVFEIETIPAGFEKKLINMDNVLRHLLIREK